MRSAQRARALDRLASPRGVICGAAVDHRDSLQAVLAKRGCELDDAGITELKAARRAPRSRPRPRMILLDAEYAVAQAIAAGACPARPGSSCRSRRWATATSPRSRVTQFLEGWSPAKARRLGASGAKLLLPYRADVADQAGRQEDGRPHAPSPPAARRASRSSSSRSSTAATGEERAGGDRFAELVVAGRPPAGERSSRTSSSCSTRVPPAACEAARRGLRPLIPWVLLGGGASEDVIGGQIEDACRAGASGFIVGRTLFDAGLVTDPDESRRALVGHSRPLLERLAAIAEELATPWRDRVGVLPQPPREWYR